MRISLFYEFPLPRPWGEDDERKLFQDGLDEVEAADKAGFSTVWLTPQTGSMGKCLVAGRKNRPGLIKSP